MRYAQESFAGRVPGIRSLVSFVRLTVDARHAGSATATVRFVASPGSRARLVTDGRGALEHERGALPRAWCQRCSGSPGCTARVRARVAVDEAAYDAALRTTERFWGRELARGASFDVPERRVLDAERSLLVQQRILTWRYSVGNPYEELSFAEALDAARVMAAYGHADVSEAILHFALRRLPVRFTSWRAGAVLVTAAELFRLTRDPTVLDNGTPALATALSRLARQVGRAGGSGLLDREQFSSDVRRRVLGLHGQAIAWQGLLAIGRVWEQDHPRLAARARIAAVGSGRRSALPFVPRNVACPTGRCSSPRASSTACDRSSGSRRRATARTGTW